MAMSARCYNLFTTHPTSIGETYTEHLRFALRFGATMVAGGLACIVHGLLPFCLATSASRRIRALHATLSHHPKRRSSVHSGANDQNLNDNDLIGDVAAFTFSI